MFIKKAYAQAVDGLAELEGQIPAVPEQSAGDLLMSNLMVLAVLVFLFYILLIRPQQKRIEHHNKMLTELKKGDKVITGGGLVGKVDKVIPEKDEIIVDLGEMKVTALRSTIHRKDDPRLRQAPANANDKSSDKKADAKAADDKPKADDKKPAAKTKKAATKKKK